MGKSVIAVLRVPFDALSKWVEGEADDGWTKVRGVEEGSYEARARGDAIVVRISDVPEEVPDAFALRALLGDVLDQHDDDRGVFVATSVPDGDGYDALVATAGAWVKPEKAGLTSDAEKRFEELLEKRSSREALAAKLAADLGKRDAGSVVDAEDGEEKKTDESRLHAALDRRFAASHMRGELDQDLRETLEAPPETTGEDGEPKQEETAG